MKIQHRLVADWFPHTVFMSLLCKERLQSLLRRSDLFRVRRTCL